MDKNLEFVVNQRVKRTMEALEKNNMEAHLVNNKVELIGKIKDICKEGEVVSVGGSMTLFETGVIDFLRSGKYEFLDRYKEGLTPEEVKEVFRKSFFADSYFTSSNAITESGWLYNVDGNGNRVAAMLYGPDKVIVIAGVNKIVKDLDGAIERNKEISAPANCIRLNRSTPCSKIGYCSNCNSKDRICNEYTLIKRQREKGRITVIFLKEDFGY